MKKKNKLDSEITNLNINPDILKENMLYQLKRAESNRIIGLFTTTGTLTLALAVLLLATKTLDPAIDTTQTVIGYGCGINTIISYIEVLINLKERKKLEKEELERIEKEIQYFKEKEETKKRIKIERMKAATLNYLEEENQKQKTLEKHTKE